MRRFRDILLKIACKIYLLPEVLYTYYLSPSLSPIILRQRYEIFLNLLYQLCEPVATTLVRDTSGIYPFNIVQLTLARLLSHRILILYHISYFRYLSLFYSFSSALEARKVLADSLIAYQAKQQRLNIRALQLLLERGDLNRPSLRHTYNLLPTCVCKKRQSQEIRNFISLITSDSCYGTPLTSCFRTVKATGKPRAAIMGPYDIQEQDLESLHAHSIMVLINPMNQTLLNSLHVSPIAFFNANCANTYTDRIIELSHRYREILVKPGTSQSAFTKLSNMSKVPVSYFHLCDNIIYNDYGANMVQHILYNLLIHGFHHCTLYGVTAYNSPRLYSNSYLEQFPGKTATEDRNQEIPYYTLRLHDPISNFLFLRLLKNSGFISYDTSTTESIDIPVEQYVDFMDEYYTRYY